MLLWPGAQGCVGDLSRSACKHANVLPRSVPSTCKQAPCSASTVEGRPEWDGGTSFNGAAVFWLSQGSSFPCRPGFLAGTVVYCVSSVSNVFMPTPPVAQPGATTRCFTEKPKPLRARLARQVVYSAVCKAGLAYVRM